MSFLNAFEQEALELLKEIELGFAELEKSPESDEHYKKVYRLLKSLKGAAGMMGLDEIQEHLHRTLDKLNDFENKKLEIKKNIKYFLSAIDHTDKLIQGKKSDFVFLEEGISNDGFAQEKAEEALKLLDKAYHLLMYQFVDVDEFLQENNKDLIRETIRKEITEIGISFERLKRK